MSDAAKKAVYLLKSPARKFKVIKSKQDVWAWPSCEHGYLNAMFANGGIQRVAIRNLKAI